MKVGDINLRLIKSNINIIAFATYAIVSIIFTYPVAFLSDSIPGYGDAFWFLWDYWWFKEALLSFENPYFTYFIYYPTGINLAFSTLSQFNAVISIPLQLAVGLVRAYNLIWIFTFVLSGYGTYLLVKYLTGDLRASFISGLIFMFCPYRFIHALGHMNLTSTEWIPFFVLFLIKTTKEDKISNPCWAALFLFLISMSDYYYLIYSFIFIVMFILYYQFTEQNLTENVIKRLLIFIISFTIILFPFILPLINELLVAKSNYMYAGRFVEYSADLVGFFIPSLLHPVFREIVSPIYLNFTGDEAEYTTYAGFTVIILSAISTKIRDNNVKFFIFSAGIFFVLCLGPILHINGAVSYPLLGHDIYIPLPYLLLSHIPVFSLARVPSRWDIMLMLSLAILSGYGSRHIFIKNKNKNNVLFFVIASLILFEFLSIPFPISSARIPIFYERLSNDTSDFAVLEIPGIVYDQNFTYYTISNWGYDERFAMPSFYHPDFMYYQSSHGKKLVNGYASRIPSSVDDFFSTVSFISQLIYLPTKKLDRDILPQNSSEIGPNILKFYNVKYLILHPSRLSADRLRIARDLLERDLKLEPMLSNEDSLLVYELDKAPIRPFIALITGWYDMEAWNGVPTRWMENDATLLVYSNNNCTTDLKMKVLSFYRPRTLEIYSNDEIMSSISIPTSPIELNLPIGLKKGGNFLRFHVQEGCQRPCDIKNISNQDARCLSLAVQNIRLQAVS